MKSLDRVQQLFRLGCPDAVVNAKDSEGCTALYWASSEGSEAVVRELLPHGADVNIHPEDGWTPLMTACTSYRSLAVVRVLCDAPGIDLAARGGAERSCRRKPALAWALDFYKKRSPRDRLLSTLSRRA